MELKLRVFLDTYFMSYIQDQFKNLNKQPKNIYPLGIFHKFIESDSTEIYLTNGFKINKSDLMLVINSGKKEDINFTLKVLEKETIKSYPFSYVFCKCENIEELKKSGILIFSTDDFLESWAKFVNKESKLKITNNISNAEFKSWHELQSYPLIGKNIIIFDPYFLLNDYETNFFNTSQILANLLKINHNYGLEQVKIFMLSLLKDRNLTLDKTEVENIILQNLKKEDLHVKYEIKIIPFKTKRKIHDRGILLNYGFITTGKGFHIFQTNNQIHPNIDTTVLSIETNPIDFAKYLRTYLPEVYKHIKNYNDIKNLPIFTPLQN